MGGRYYLTGVQLGMLMALIKDDPGAVFSLLKKIKDKQYLCDAEEFDAFLRKEAGK